MSLPLFFGGRLMSETTFLVSEQIGLLLAEQYSGPDDDSTTELWPYEIGPVPITDNDYDEGDGD
jgi:hypothetical protein